MAAVLPTLVLGRETSVVENGPAHGGQPVAFLEPRWDGTEPVKRRPAEVNDGNTTDTTRRETTEQRGSRR